MTLLPFIWVPAERFEDDALDDMADDLDLDPATILGVKYWLGPTDAGLFSVVLRP